MAPPSKSYLQAAGAATDIAQMEAKALAALVPAMAAAQKELAQDLQKWITKLGPNAADQKFTAAQIRQMQILLGVAEAQANNPKGSFPKVAAAAVNKAMNAQMPQARAVQTLEGQLNTLRAKFDNLPSPQLVHAALIAQGDKLVINRFAKSSQRYAGQVKDDLKLQFGIGLAKGETLQQLTKRIAGLSNFQKAVDASHPPQAAAAMAGGLTKRYHNWAQRLARTELNNAYNFSALQGIKAAHALDDRIVMVWDATNDMRVCPHCKALHGKKATPGGAFPGGYTQPPAHPNCRCALVSWMDDWEDDMVVDVPTVEEVERKEREMEKRVDKGTKRKEPEAPGVKKADLETHSQQTIKAGTKADKERKAAEAPIVAPPPTIEIREKDGWFTAHVGKGKTKPIGQGSTYEQAMERAQERLAMKAKDAARKAKALAQKEAAKAEREAKKANKAAGIVGPAPDLKVGDPIPAGARMSMLRRFAYVTRNEQGRFVLNARGVAFFLDKHKKEEKKAAGVGVGTCQICTSQCAIVRNMISIHGYNRPGHGYITGTCKGSQRLPWEVSNDAVAEWIGELEAKLAQREELLRKFPERKEFAYRKKVEGKVLDELVFVTDEDPRFAGLKASALTELENDIDKLKQELTWQRSRLKSWKPRPLKLA